MSLTPNDGAQIKARIAKRWLCRCLFVCYRSTTFHQHTGLALKDLKLTSSKVTTTLRYHIPPPPPTSQRGDSAHLQTTLILIPPTHTHTHNCCVLLNMKKLVLSMSKFFLTQEELSTAFSCYLWSIELGVDVL